MDKPWKILVVGGKEAFDVQFRDAMKVQGCRVSESGGIRAGLRAFQAGSPDLVVLVRALPDGDGLALCRAIRSSERRRETPVILLDPSAELEARLQGFEAGVDQCLGWPMDVSELLLWVNALLRRLDHVEARPKCLQRRDLCIDKEAHLVRYMDQDFRDLTKRELDLLYLIVAKAPRVLSREYLINAVWRTAVNDHAVDSQLTNLRRKIPRGLADRIQNVHGKGYCYVE